MNNSILLIGDMTDFDTIPNKLIEDVNIKKFTFDLSIHQVLKNKNIDHEIADDLLNEEDRLKIFNQMLQFRRWYDKDIPNDLKFEDVNILKLFDTHEFSSYLMPILVNFILIKKILDKEKPEKIISTNYFKKIINLYTKNSNIKIQYYANDVENKLLWDKIEIKYNVGKFSISFNLSKKLYLKLKRINESLLGLTNNFWLSNDSTRKSIIFLEFNPAIHSTLFTKFKNYDGNIVLVNRRRSAVWNKKSTKIVKDSNLKIVNFEKILDKNEQLKISTLIIDYSKKLDIFWENSNFFNKLFQINGIVFGKLFKKI